MTLKELKDAIRDAEAHGVKEDAEVYLRVSPCSVDVDLEHLRITFNDIEADRALMGDEDDCPNDNCRFTIYGY